MPSDPRQAAIEALAEALPVAWGRAELDPRLMASNALAILDAHPAAQAALAVWLNVSLQQQPGGCPTCGASETWSTEPFAATPAETPDTTGLREAVPIAAITGMLLHRAWVKSGRRDPLVDADAWDGFALTVQAVARVEGIIHDEV